MPRPKNPERANEIKRVVCRLFADKGYHGTSMRDVGREVGMNQSSLYNHFKSKESVLFLLMNEAMDEALATMIDICGSTIGPEEKLSQVLDFYTRYYAGDRDKLTLLVNEMPSLQKKHHIILLDKQREFVRLVRSILEELNEHALLKSIDPSVAAFTFFGMVHYTIKWYSKDGPVKPDALADIFVEIFTRGVLKK